MNRVLPPLKNSRYKNTWETRYVTMCDIGHPRSSMDELKEVQITVKRFGLLNREKIIFHYDNYDTAGLSVAQNVQQNFHESGWEIL